MLYHWLGVRELIDPHARMVGMYFDDPDAVAENKLRSMACTELFEPNAVKFEALAKRFEIEGGEFAVLTHVGPYAQLCFAYRWLYGENGCRSRDGKRRMRRFFEVYINNPRDTGPSELVTEIWLPVKKVD